MASITEETTNEVYALTGVALHWAQCFEASMTNFLILHARLTGTVTTLESSDKLEAEYEKSTMGQLAKKLRQFAVFDDDAEEILKSAIQERNRLMHRFFQIHAETFLSENGAKGMLKELQNCTILFRKADLIARTMGIAAAKACGVSEDDIQREYEAMNANAKNG